MVSVWPPSLRGTCMLSLSLSPGADGCMRGGRGGRQSLAAICTALEGTVTTAVKVITLTMKTSTLASLS
jgi:hypothetical protein